MAPGLSEERSLCLVVPSLLPDSSATAALMVIVAWHSQQPLLSSWCQLRAECFTAGTLLSHLEEGAVTVTAVQMRGLLILSKRS